MAAAGIVYLNGEILPAAAARLPLEERGLLFADGVYEVLRFYGGRGFRIEEHLRRLRESLATVEIGEPEQLAELAAISQELLRRNDLGDATVYWQITRGVATRDPLYPHDVEPTIFALVYPQAPFSLRMPAPIRTITAADLRWHRCSVKSIQLLPNVLARNAAARAGCEAAILLRGETVTEATSANLAIVRGECVRTHPADAWILDGITRRALLECTHELGLELRETPFSRVEMMLADEVFLCGTTTHVTPIAQIDGCELRRSAPGPITTRLHEALLRKIAGECGLDLES